jgi:hypothetical protein
MVAARWALALELRVKALPAGARQIHKEVVEAARRPWAAQAAGLTEVQAAPVHLLQLPDQRLPEGVVAVAIAVLPPALEVLAEVGLAAIQVAAETELPAQLTPAAEVEAEVVLGKAQPAAQALSHFAILALNA